LVAGAYTINGTITTTNVQLINGTLAGINVIAGGFNWVVGWWNGSVVTVASNCVMQVTTGNDHNLPNCTFTNLGTVAWSGGRIRGGSTSIYNLGLWDAQSDQVINNDYGGNGTLFNNAGTFRKSAGTGAGATALLGGVTFNNTGTLDIQTNLLSLQGGGSFTGGLVTGAPGLIQLAAGGFTINGTITTANVQLVGGGLAGANLIKGAFTWLGGVWDNSVVTIASNSLVAIGGGGGMANCIVTNYGTVARSGGTIGGSGNPATSIYNFGVWDAQSDQTIDNALFSNAGTFRKSGGTGTNTTVLGGALFFNNTGRLDVQTNLLSLQGGGSFTGGFVTGAPGLMQLAAGTYTINGTVTTTNVQLIGGGFTGTNVLNGGFDWVVGDWGGSVVTVASNSLLQVTTGYDHNMANCTLTNLGTVAWSGGRIRGGNTFIYNFGLWDAQSDQVINNDYGGSGTRFNNAGTLRKSAGTGATSLLGGVSISNTGTLDVQSGTIAFQGGGGFTGGLVTSAPGLVQLVAGAYTINGTITTTNVQLVNGTLTGINVIAGGFNWVVGSWNGSVVTVAGNTVLAITTANNHDLPNCVVTNYGTVAWSSGTLRGGGGNTTLIYNYGVWDSQGDLVFNDGFGTGTGFYNFGTLRKSAGANSTELQAGVGFSNLGGGIEVDSGQLSVGGNDYLQGGGLLAIELGGLGAGQFGQFASSGSASLGGPFRASVVNGFAPALGNIFQVVSCSSLSGSFASLNVPTGISVNYSNNSVFLVVTGGVPFLQIAGQPTNQTVLAGGTAIFSVTAAGTAPFSYQWQLNGTNLTDNGRITGSQSNLLTFASVLLSDAGNYQVIVTNIAGSLTSSNATLTLLNCSPPPSGLVSWWPGNGNASDIIGGSNGTLTNGATFAAGEVGQAFSFNGTNQFVLIPDSPHWAFGSNDFTIDLWVNFNSVKASNPLIANDEGGFAVNKWIFLLNNGQLEFHINSPASGNPGIYIGSTPFAPNPGEWHHVAMTKGGATYTFYVDGNPGSPASNSIPVPDAAAPLTIGYAEPGPSVNGLIDEVDIFNRALTSAEVAAIYAAGSAGKCVPTVPQITLQPASQSVQCGSNAVFSVTATSAATLSYQWYLFGTNAVSGATNTSLALSNISLSASGRGYSVVVTNFSGSVTSQVATLTVQDTIPPVVTLNGSTNMTIECHTSFTDPGATAFDTCAGSLPVTTNGAVNFNATGTYILSYVATDPSGNSATNSRTVHVVDTTPPVVTVLGHNPFTNECHTAFIDPGATASDTCAGSLSVTTNSTVNPNAVGTYTISYIATDPSGNSATNTRMVRVVDKTRPVVTLLGANPLTNECHTPFVDPGATATDTCAGSLGVTTNSPVNPNAVGTYTIIYVATDPSGNSATNTRTVRVVDTTPPIVTLNGGATISVVQSNSFTDPGATANDTCAGSLPIVANGTVNVDVLGTYIITYIATDFSGNSATNTRAVVVVLPVSPPVFTIEPTNVTAECGSDVSLIAAASGATPLSY
jgi:hypothetical protein